MEQSALAANIQEVERLYRVREKDRVEEFLSSHPGLVDILLEARPHIERQFGRDVVVELRFSRIFEGDTEADLFAKIQTSLDLDTANELFDSFWDEWFGEASGRPEAWPLYINLEFVERESRD